jgi:uncharacterized protein YoxC
MKLTTIFKTLYQHLNFKLVNHLFKVKKTIMTTKEKALLEERLNSLLTDAQGLLNEVGAFYNDVRTEEADDDEALDDVDDVTDSITECENTIADAVQYIKDARVSFEAPLSTHDDDEEEEEDREA